MEKKSFVKGAAILAGAGLLVKLIGAVYRIPLFNIVGAEGMSYYEVVYPYYSALLVISSAGLPTAISKMVAERVTLNDYRGAHRIYRSALTLLFGLGLLTSFLMFFGADILSGSTALPESDLSFKALAPSLLFVSVMCAYRGYLQGLQLMTGTAVSQVLEQAGKLAVGFTLAAKMLPLGPQYAAMGALIGVSASELLALIVIYIFYRRRKNEFSGLRNSQDSPRRSFGSIASGLLAIAVPVSIGASIMPLTGIADSVMIVRILLEIGFSMENAQAAYAILRSSVMSLINMPAVLTMALAMSLVPAISSRMAEKDYKGVKRNALTGMKLALIIGLPCAAGLYVLAGPILDMLYPKLTEEQLMLGESLMRISAVGVIFLSLVQTLTGIIQGMGKQVVPVVNLLIGGILKVVTMMLLMRIPEINIKGAAVSTVVCYTVAGLLDMVYMVGKTKMRVNIIDVFLKPLFSAVIMAVSVSLCYKALLAAIHTTFAALGSVLIGVAIYGILVILLKMFSREDLASMPGGKRLMRIMYGK
ncbi:MAG: Stage V sporulation protein B [Firmicutes bacterium ADurb.Bin182]|nr:MAG: Stage V sporulation protein B [Firmicutes bacterium ADurb.Bin182]